MKGWKALEWRKLGQMDVFSVILGVAMAWLMQSLQVVRVSSPAPSEQGGCLGEHHPPFIVGLGWRRFGSHSPGRLLFW